MTQGAQELLSILSMLPDGLTDADLVQAKLPIIDILACKTTLIQISLASAPEGTGPNSRTYIPYSSSGKC
jgi:hypothetical protein